MSETPDDYLGQGFDSGTGYTPQGPEATGINPAWNELLSQIPEDKYSEVTPILDKWDKGVQQRFKSVHDQYAPYKPFMDSGIGTEDINFALGLLNAVQTEPDKVMKALQEWQDNEMS